MMSTGEGNKLFLGSVDNNQLSDAEKQALLDNAVHEAKWVDQDGKKRLACAACTKTFSDRGHLRTHYNTVHLKTMYKCTVVGCEEWFSSMRARQRHIQSAHTPKPAGSPAVQPQQASQASQPFQQHQLIQPQQPQTIAQQVIHPHTLIQQQAHPQQTVMQPIMQHPQQLVQHSPMQSNMAKNQLVHAHPIVHPQQVQTTQVYQTQQPQQQHFVQQATTVQSIHHVQNQQQQIQPQQPQQQFQQQQQQQQFQQPQPQYQQQPQQPQQQQQQYQRFQQPHQHQQQQLQPAPQFQQTQQFQQQVRAPVQAVQVARHPQPQQAVTIVSTGIPVVTQQQQQAQPVTVLSSQAYPQEAQAHVQHAQVVQSAQAAPGTQTMLIPCAGTGSSTVTATTVQVVSSSAAQPKHTCPEHSHQQAVPAMNGHQCHVSNPAFAAAASAQPTAATFVPQMDQASQQQQQQQQQQPQQQQNAFAQRGNRSPPNQTPEQVLQQQQQQQFVQQQQQQQQQQEQQVVLQHSQTCQQHAGQSEINRTTLDNVRPTLKRENGVDSADSEGQPPAKIAAAEAAVAPQEEEEEEEEGEEDAGKRERLARSRAEREANEALAGFLDRLQELDLNGYFAYPMTEATHPGCTVQLDRLSDLYSVRQKLRRGRYTSAAGLKALREDLDLVFTNAMKFYAEKSPEYRLAAKLWKTADDGLASLCAEFPARFPQLFGPASEAPGVCDAARGTTLPFLQPCNRGRVGKHRVATIGQEIGRPSNCVGPLPPLRDDRRNKIIPVSYLDYGPFASFAPTYDSGAAYCTKEDSDLVLSEFGPLSNGCADRLNELNEDNALVVPEPELGDDFSLYMLNALTKDVLKEEREDGAESMTLEEILEEDVTFGEKEAKEEAEAEPSALLAETASKLGCLREANFQRLSQPHSRAAHAPAAEEQALAERVAASLALMVGRNRPDDVVSTAALHRSMKVDLSGSNATTASSRVACGEA